MGLRIVTLFIIAAVIGCSGAPATGVAAARGGTTAASLYNLGFAGSSAAERTQIIHQLGSWSLVDLYNLAVIGESRRATQVGAGVIAPISSVASITSIDGLEVAASNWDDNRFRRVRALAKAYPTLQDLWSAAGVHPQALALNAFSASLDSLLRRAKDEPSWQVTRDDLVVHANLFAGIVVAWGKAPGLGLVDVGSAIGTPLKSAYDIGKNRGKGMIQQLSKALIGQKCDPGVIKVPVFHEDLFTPQQVAALNSDDLIIHGSQRYPSATVVSNLDPSTVLDRQSSPDGVKTAFGGKGNYAYYEAGKIGDGFGCTVTTTRDPEQMAGAIDGYLEGMNALHLGLPIDVPADWRGE